MSDHRKGPSDRTRNHHVWHPPSTPPEDYPLTTPGHPPPSLDGGPVVFPVDPGDGSTNSDFQDFVWDVVSAISQVNSGLFAFKRGVAMGLDPAAARAVYDIALRNYDDLFEKWKAEIEDEYTWIHPAISPDGYVTEVVVRSRAFSVHTPGQSESHNSTNPPGRG